MITRATNLTLACVGVLFSTFCAACVGDDSTVTPPDAQSDAPLGSDASDSSVMADADGSALVDASGDGFDGSLPYRRVFVTSHPYAPNFGGVAGGDAICNTVATGAGLGGIWAAWLSDSTSSATSRLEHASVPYQLLDGTEIAMNWAQLTSGHLENLIDKDEHKALQTTPPYVYTGTNSDGTTASGLTCNDWNYDDSDCNSPVYYGAAGDMDVATLQWSYAVQSGCCGAGQLLYCVEQP